MEGSETSKLIKGKSNLSWCSVNVSDRYVAVPGAIDPSWQYREGRQKRYDSKRLGGTIVVHYIKKNMWFLETAMAFLEGDDVTEMEKHQAEEEAASRSGAPKKAVALNTNGNLIREHAHDRISAVVTRGHPPEGGLLQRQRDV